MSRRVILIGVAVIAVAGAASAFLVRGGGPSFDGRSAGAWGKRLAAADRTERERARARLCEGGADAVPVLVSLGARRALEVTTARVVAEIGPDAVPPLVERLRAGGIEERRVAADLIGSVGYGDAEALAALLAALEDPEAPVRWSAARAIARVAVPGEGVAAALERRFEDPVTRVRHEAAWAHHRLFRRPEAVISVFVAELRGERADFFRGAFALEELGPHATPAVPALVERLEADDPWIWSTSARVLFEIGPSAAAAAPALARRLEVEPAPDPSVGPSEWRRVLARLRLGCAAALVVVEPGNPTGRAAIERVLAAGTPMEKVSALRAVWRAGLDRDRVLGMLPGLVADPASAGRAARLAAVVGPSAEACVPALVELLADPIEARNAALALAAIEPPPRVVGPALREVLASGPLSARGAAAYALWRVSGRADEGVAELLEVIEEAGRRDQEAAYGAVALLAEMSGNSGRALRALRDVSREAAWPARLAAEKALDILGRDDE